MATASRDQATLLRNALKQIKQLRAQVEALELARSEPIAVIGLACRFPGAVTEPEGLWQLLEDGRDAVREVPPQRWELATLFDRDPGAPGKLSTRWAGLLADYDHFDAEFFGITPREAERMDPHQRIWLEVAWEALDRAGQRVPDLRGSRTGVFVGLSPMDYPALEFSRGSEIDSYSATGACGSVVAGRFSYQFDLRGPSVVVDTACSSALVAVHYACKSLRNGECEMAVAGGINLLLAPWSTIATSKMRTMASDGRCKTFDARADGYVRAEGCGALVLKPLSKARAASDPIWAVIRGSAVNQDGRSTSLTAPSLTSQREVIEAALQDARATAGEVGFVETHGTGTSLGDPIEVEALNGVYGRRDLEAAPCVLGAAKTVFGHLEAAAGVVGLSKAIMTLRRGRITPVLNFQRLNPNIEIDGTPLVIPTQSLPWPRGERPRVAAVSSFGFCGTNSHLIVQEAPPIEADLEAGLEAGASDRESELDGPYVLPISAHQPAPLRTLAARYRDVLGATTAEVQDVCHTAALRRTEHAHRLAIVAGDPAALRGALDDWVQGRVLPSGSVHAVAEHPRAPVFVFSGQGGQWRAMGAALIGRYEVFRDAIARCEEALRPHVDWSLQAVLTSDRDLNSIEVCQPAIFAMQVALAQLWGSLGVSAGAVVGHSLGEVAAAHVAGALSLEDAALVICTRSRLLQRLSGRGGMAVVGLSAEQARKRLLEHGGGLEIAVSLGPRQVVLCGDVAAIDAILEQLSEQNVFGRRVRVDVASHHPQVDALSEELQAGIASITPRAATLPIYSSVLAAPLEGTQCTASYWFRNMRQPVLFHETINATIDGGHEAFIEISPHPVLQIAIEQTAASRERTTVAVASMRRDVPLESFAEAAASLWAHGHAIDWRPLLRRGRPTEHMPTYPWQHERYPVRDWREHALRRPEEDRGTKAGGDLYQLTWHAVPREGADAARPPCVLVLADAGGLADQLCVQIERAGGRCMRVYPNDRGPEGSSGASTAESLVAESLVVDPTSARGFGPLVDALTDREGHPFDHVLYLWGLDVVEDPPGGLLEPGLRACCGGLLHFLQATAGVRSLTGSRLWIVTRGAQRLECDPASVATSQATLWGLGRVLAEEHPEIWGGLVDLDPRSANDDAAAVVLAEAANGARREQVAYRGGERRVLRLSPLGGSAAPAQPVEIRADATYLIIGGLGGLGLESARWLAGSGARHLICVSRSGKGEGAEAVLGELREAGCEVLVVKADVSDRAALERALDEALAVAPPLRGVIHTAAVVSDGVLLKLGWSQFRDVFAAKAQGSWNVHALTRRHALDFFIMYSSAAALVGLLGHATYAASNVFLDALAHHRRSLGLPALSVNWPAWTQVGLGKRVAGREPIPGMRSIAVAEGFEMLERMMSRDDAQCAVMPVDWGVYFAAVEDEFDPVFTQMKERPAASGQAPLDSSPAQSALQLQLQRALPSERMYLLTSYLREQVASALGRDVAAASEEAGFFQLGMDSIRALELKNNLQNALGRSLPTTVIFDHPTVASLAEFLLPQLVPSDSPKAEGSDSSDSSDDAEQAKMLEVLEQLDLLSEGELEELKQRGLNS
ncbi:MAG: type I polyketide synthase [Myxococcota bacterium]